jgi:hypothetical protein
MAIKPSKKSKSAAHKYEKRKHDLETKTVGAIDTLSDIESVFGSVMPQLLQDLKAGLGAKEIAAKYSALAQARLVTTALRGSESAALTAARDILDRSLGKATEVKKIEHSMAQASEEEIDALLESKLRDVKEVSDE